MSKPKTQENPNEEFLPENAGRKFVFQNSRTGKYFRDGGGRTEMVTDKAEATVHTYNPWVFPFCAGLRSMRVVFLDEPNAITDDIKLLPCPFCGSERTYAYMDSPGRDRAKTAQVVCLNCGSGSSSVLQWNTRVGADGTRRIMAQPKTVANFAIQHSAAAAMEAEARKGLKPVGTGVMSDCFVRTVKGVATCHKRKPKPGPRPEDRDCKCQRCGKIRGEHRTVEGRLCCPAGTKTAVGYTRWSALYHFVPVISKNPRPESFKF